MTEREKIERLKQMLLRMCEAVECADCPLLGEECELAEYLTDEKKSATRLPYEVRTVYLEFLPDAEDAQW